MELNNLFRRLRGALGNALVWGAGWYVAAMAAYAALRVLGIIHPADSLVGALRSGIKFAIMGAIAGTAFSSFIGLRYRGRRLSEISWLRFGIGGAVITGIFVPFFMIVMRMLSGDPFLSLEVLLVNGLVGAAFGGAAAAVSLKVAQAADGMLPRTGEDHAGLREGDERPRSIGVEEIGLRKDAVRRGGP